MIAASLLKRVGMQTMFYEKDMNDGCADNKKLSLQEINQNQAHRKDAADKLNSERQEEAEKIWEKIVTAKENQSEDRKREIGAAAERKLAAATEKSQQRAGAAPKQPNHHS